MAFLGLEFEDVLTLKSFSAPAGSWMKMKKLQTTVKWTEEKQEEGKAALSVEGSNPRRGLTWHLLGSNPRVLTLTLP